MDSNYFFLPITKNDYDNSPPFTYTNSKGPHGYGKLDMAANTAILNFKGHTIYSMTDGIVMYNGDMVWEGGSCTCLTIKPKILNIGRTYYIRYLHGDFDLNLIPNETEVKMGLPIGKINGYYEYNPHLHVDFSYAYNAFVPVVGTLTSNSFTLNNKTFSIDMTDHMRRLLADWCEDNSGPVFNPQGETPNIGYCWLVFASKLSYLTPDTSPPEDRQKINYNLYLRSAGSNDNELAVDAYFNRNFSEQFCGPPPKDWDSFTNGKEYKGLRCLMDFVLHELGSGGWIRSAAIHAKMMRAIAVGMGYINSTQSIRNAKTFYDWFYAALKQFPYWIGEWSINNGTNCINPSNILYIRHTDENFKYITATYNNFRYPNIYGLSLNDDLKNKEHYNESLIKAASIMPMTNGGYWIAVDPRTGIETPMVAAAIETGIVNYFPADDKDYGKRQQDSYENSVLLYRQDGNINYFNRNVL